MAIPLFSGTSRSKASEAGFTLVELVIVTFLIGILAAIAVPTYISFIQKAREATAISYLSKAKKAQEVYMIDNLAGLYSASFDELETTGVIESGVGVATRVVQEYQFDLTAAVVAGESVWSIAASPLSANPGARHFYVDQTGVIRYAVGGAANAASAPVQ